MENLSPQKMMVYFITAISCCGVATFYQVYTSPLDSFIPRQPLIDNSTFANVDEVQTVHFNLSAAVNFDDQSISGNITHTMQVVSFTDKVIFDIWGQSINSVHMCYVEEPHLICDELQFKIFDQNPVIG